ncbi:MAG TPA: translation initiation factor IF-5A, partial [Candidatus Nanoarchaeia archaeon]|nr:translation initiation factor IF-5A [Candidatus Nanoarchaeia archaeon]
MVLKIINASEAKTGTNVTLEGTHYTIKSIDISKTGKHGHAKCRIEAVGIINGQKKVFVVPGHERFEVPLVEKK